ncbi:MAG: hypothetical protein CBC35_05440 [Planctomycetes bacterium TMED75]|nr:hypothetical protein [Planctomycetaceae bacterium]OUU93553.1 MAG: hypothetical protein CBC35_05440 [Planctomycetes bacterium TMED75]
MGVDTRCARFLGQLLTHALIRDVLQAHGAFVDMVGGNARGLREPGFPEPMRANQASGLVASFGCEPHRAVFFDQQPVPAQSTQAVRGEGGGEPSNRRELAA